MKRGPHTSAWMALLILVSAIYLLLYAPIIVTAIASFNDAPHSTFPPHDMSIRWWREAFSAKWLNPMWFSVKLAFLAAIGSTILGLPIAIAITRYRFAGRNLITAITLGPLMIPTIATGLGILQLFTFSGFSQMLGFPALMCAHVVICLPFTVRAIAASINGLPPSLELAAASLGASPWKVNQTIFLPMIRNGLTGGFLFAFVQSFTDVNTSLFLSKPAEVPVTLRILGELEFGFPPVVAAVGVLTILVPLAAIALLERSGGFGRTVAGASK